MRSPRHPDDSAEKIWALILLLAAIWLLAIAASGCAVPSLLGLGGSEPVAPSADPVSGFMDSATSNLWSWAWLSVLLLLFLPGIRQPMLTLWTAIFNALAIPFLFIREKFDTRAKHGNKKRTTNRRSN